ncbi:MAG TPA: hypothetical protein VJN43_10110 [Bryobacteraceae bacterium]|nr:hypothetical protein [Bryobacteraceae bacterium]
MRFPIYAMYGMFLLALTGYAEYSGWSLLRVNEVKNIPKTVRDNPGAYRSHYAGYSRYFGGK